MSGSRRQASSLLTRYLAPQRANNAAAAVPSVDFHSRRWNHNASSTIPNNRLLSSPYDGFLRGSSISSNLGQQTSVRGMAIKRSKNRKGRNAQQQQDLPLMNEKLVKQLMSQSYASSPDTLKLRLVVEKDAKTPTTSAETSLADAIQEAVDLGLDLVEIDLKQEPPVVRAVAYEAKLYRSNKAKAKKASSKKDAGMKQFRFKAKTEDYDLQRKIKGVVDALEKGHNCKVSATCASRVVASTNPLGAAEVIERVMKEIGSIGEAVNPPEVNVEKTHATVMLSPTKK